MNPNTNKDPSMHRACLEKAPRVAQGFCLQLRGHPGTHQAYVKDALIEWEPQLIELPTPGLGYLSSTAA